MKETGQSRYLYFIEKAASVLLLTYPTFMLVVKGGMNGAFLLMLLLALVVRIKHPVGLTVTMWQKEWTIYALAMVAMTVAIFLSQSYHQNYISHSYDGASRYWLAIPVFLLLRRLDMKIFRMLQYAFPVAAVTGFLLAKEIDGSGRSGISTLDLIHFGDFEMIMGMMSLLCINWLGNDKPVLRTLKILGFVAGLAASFYSGSRGGWMAIPVFVALYIYFNTNVNPLRMVISTAIAVTLISVLLYSFNTTLHQRMQELTHEVVALDQGDQDTSTGIRWQLYKAAVDVFVRHPIFGVGPDGFALEMEPMMKAGKITPEAAKLGRGEVHNDILSKSAGLGIFGLASMLAVYWVPIWLFWKATRFASGQVRQAGMLGIVFVSGFLISGFTVEILNLTMAIAFYSFTVAVLLAFCYNIHREQLATN